MANGDSDFHPIRDEPAFRADPRLAQIAPRGPASIVATSYWQARQDAALDENRCLAPLSVEPRYVLR